MEERLKDLYERELKHLRTHADEFFARQPFRALAARLGHRPNAEYRDPFVEWVLQGYAFLAARVRRRLDAEFPRFTQALLSVTHPLLVAPTPSMLVARFPMRPDPSKLEGGALLARGAQLVMPVRSAAGAPRRNRRAFFTTGRAVRLWPVEVDGVRYLPDPPAVAAAGASEHAEAAIAVTLALTPTDATLAEFHAEDLDLFVRGTEDGGGALFEALAFAARRCEAVGGGARPAPVEAAPLGFDREAPLAPGPESAPPDRTDALLPLDARSFDGWRLLSEFFGLPERFQFLRLKGLRRAFAGRAGGTATLLFLLDRPFPALAGRVGKDALLTNCAPAVNLFRHGADDLDVDPREVEHAVLPDRADPTGYEPHSVLGVRGVTHAGEEVVFRPFFQEDAFGAGAQRGRRYFQIIRRPRERPAAREEQEGGLEDYVGADLYVSIVDESAQPAPAFLKALSFDLLCTNRHLAVFAAHDAGGAQRLTSELDEGWRHIEVVAGPSAGRPGLPEGRRLWDAVSALSLNHLSLVDGDGRVGSAGAALRQLLRLHASDDDVAAQRLIGALTGVSARPVSRRTPPLFDRAGDLAAPMAFARGLEVTLAIENAGGRASMLAAILERVLAGHADANSFVETVLVGEDRRTERVRFPPRAGARRVL